MSPTIASHEIELLPMDFRRLCLVADTEQEKASILEIFFKTTEEILVEMKDASRCNLPLQWKNAAHKLRGAAANIGMAALEKLFLESEKIAWIPDTSRDSLLRQINDEIAHIKAFIAKTDPFLLISGE
jgi:hypothetical protein